MFDSRPVYVGFVLEKVTLEKAPPPEHFDFRLSVSFNCYFILTPSCDTDAMQPQELTASLNNTLKKIISIIEQVSVAVAVYIFI